MSKEAIRYLENSKEILRNAKKMIKAHRKEGSGGKKPEGGAGQL